MYLALLCVFAAGYLKPIGHANSVDDDCSNRKSETGLAFFVQGGSGQAGQLSYISVKCTNQWKLPVNYHRYPYIDVEHPRSVILMGSHGFCIAL